LTEVLHYALVSFGCVPPQTRHLCFAKATYLASHMLIDT